MRIEINNEAQAGPALLRSWPSRWRRLHGVRGDRVRRTVCEIQRFKADFAIQRARLLGLCSRYGPTAVLAEQSSIGAPQLEALRLAGLQVQSWTARTGQRYSRS